VLEFQSNVIAPLSITQAAAVLVFTAIVNGVAVPDNPTVCGLVDALSVSETVAAYVPGTVGAKLAVIVQVAPSAIVTGQLFDWPKMFAAVPVSVMLLKASGTPPLLVTVTVCVLPAAPATIAGNASEGTLNVIAGAGATSVPVNATVAGPPTLASFAIDSVPA
jgi:hypothetical protein